MNRLYKGYLYRKRPVAIVLQFIDLFLKLFPRQRRKAPSTAQKILVVKPDHLGDCLMSSSVIPHLQKEYPGATIDYLAGPWSEPLLRHYKDIRKIWTIRHAQLNRSQKGAKKWFAFLSDLAKALPGIRSERYDIVLFLRASGGNLVFAGSLFKAGFLAGHGAGGGGPLLDACVEWKEGVHEVEHYAEVLKTLSINVTRQDMVPFFTPSSTKAQFALPPEYICVHPGAGAPNKLLSFETWRSILSTSHLPIVVCGGPAEVNWAREVLGDATQALDLTAKLDIEQLFQVLDRSTEAHLLDSFPAHLASVSHCKRVHVHFLPASDPVQWSPLGENVRIVRHEQP